MINMYYRTQYGFNYCIWFVVCIFDIFSFIMILVLQYELYIGACNLRVCLNGLLFNVWTFQFLGGS